MEIFVVLALVMVVGIFANKYMNSRKQVLDNETADANAESGEQVKEESESDNNVIMENKIMEERKGTRDLFLETLTKIGCQYEIGEGEDGDINFGYQGEYFLVRATNKGRYIQIYDTHWAHVELYDIDEFARLKKAINESNMRNSVTTVYTIDEAGSTVDVHCKSVILFVPEIPDIAEYLRVELADYFRAHETVNVEMAKQRAMEEEK